MKPDQTVLSATHLLSRLQAGDETAFEALFLRYYERIYGLVFRLLGNKADADDIAQQVFTKVYFAINDFDCRCLPLTWICRIAINECYSHLRKGRLSLVEEPENGPEHAANLPPVDKTLAQRDYLNKLLARLPEQERSLLIFKEVEGHSIAELAEMTGMTASAIKIKLFRARQKLVQAAERLSLRPTQATA